MITLARRIVSAGFALYFLFYLYSVSVLFLRDLKGPLPYLVFPTTPGMHKDPGFWKGVFLRPVCIRMDQRILTIPEPAKPVPVGLLVAGLLWGLAGGGWFSFSLGRELKVQDPLLAQMRQLRALREYKMLDETCTQIQRDYFGVLSPAEVIDLLRHSAEAKLKTGAGIDAITTHQRWLKEEPENEECRVGLLLSYRVAGRDLPLPMCQDLVTVFQKVRPLPEELVIFYLEQVLRPAKRGRDESPLLPPHEIFGKLSPGDPVMETIQRHLLQMVEKPNVSRGKALLALTHIDLREHNYKGATAHLKNLIGADVNAKEAYALLLEAFRGARDLPGLYELYGELLARNPDNPIIRHSIDLFYSEEPAAASLGPSLLSRFTPLEAPPPPRLVPEAEALDRSLGIDPDMTPEQRFLVALDAMKSGNPQGARLEMEALLKKKFPRVDALRAALVRCCLVLKDIPAARTQAQTITWSRLPPGELYTTARLVESSGELKWAKELYLSLMEEAPDFKDADDRVRDLDKLLNMMD